MTRHRPCRPARASGFTLVELMVAIVLSMILAIVMLKLHASFGQQRVRNSDVAERDSELRAALDVMTQDLSSTAYLFGNLTQPCDAIFTYNAAGAGVYATRRPVDAVAASGTTPSDALLLTGAVDASNFNNLTAPQITGDPTSTTTPLTTGVMRLQLPDPPAQAPVVGHVALVEAALAATSGGTLNACFRVPVTSNPSPAVYTSSGALMPPAFYSGFQPSLTAAGFGTLGNGQLLNNPKFVDLGAPATPTHVTTTYAIDNSGSFPVLVRSQSSLLDDSAIGTPQQIAAGVVSLQVRFNVGGGSYLTSAAVTSAGRWNQVCSVRIAVIARSLNDDPDPNYSWAPTALTPGTSTTVSPGAPFSDYPIPSGFTKRRYVLETTELAVRNALWARLGSLTC